MLDGVQIQLVQFVESWKRNGLIRTLNEICYRDREVIVVMKDLSTLPKSQAPPLQDNLQFLEITEQRLKELDPHYSLRSRRLKTKKNLRKGYSAFAIVRDNQVLGDMWFTASDYSHENPIHPDLNWLGAAQMFGKKDVYGFDLYVDTNERKNNVALALFVKSFNAFQQKGYKKMFAYILANNKACIRLHQIFHFEVIGKVKIRRLLIYKRTVGREDIKDQRL